MRQLSFFLSLLLSFSLSAQNAFAPIGGARGAGMGGASVAFNDINSAFSNPAGIAYLEHFSATVYAERKYGSSAILLGNVALAKPSKFGTFGVQMQYFGNPDYSDQKLGLLYARKLFQNLSLGASVNALNTSTSLNGNITTLSFELGLTCQLLKELRLGTSVYNPIHARTVNSNLFPEDYIPTILRVGGVYLPSDKVTFALEAEQNINYSVPVTTTPNPINSYGNPAAITIKAGVEYHLSEALTVRAGYKTNPSILTFGLGYRLQSGARIDASAQRHNVLGFTPGVSFSYE
ncbi:MAG: hypothetical protein RLZZ292_554 [Bacteroidota bacterium]|jgi:long-subunit fatty acid transport protein